MGASLNSTYSSKMKSPMYLDKKIINIVKEALSDPESEIYKAIKRELEKSDSSDNEEGE